ncbi:MAG: type II toxin-antitoxin system MqsA family antitoxin [Zoogloeaceae bacterium]|jgi:HTH-type transcriptional regulator/antitoxin MqsA|nr:type II toxin-antitoxin system MqsA family antitoxin [Zoogloeaceae bacterium]
MKPVVRKPRYCLQCDDGAVLELGVRDVTVHAESVTRVVPEIAGWHCPKCGEIEFIDRDSAERMDEALREAWEEARKGEADSIKSIRKKLGLRQAEAGQLFGGGVSAFSDYERGKRQPHKAVMILLNLLNHHPELLNEVRAAA